MPEVHGRIESGLPAQGWQEGIRLLLLDDLADDLGGDRLNISAIRKFRIGHDGSRIRVHQHDFVTLFPQSLARLGAGVIKFAPLTDHYRPRSNQQDFLQALVLWHSGGWPKLPFYCQAPGPRSSPVEIKEQKKAHFASFLQIL